MSDEYDESYANPFFKGKVKKKVIDCNHCGNIANMDEEGKFQCRVCSRVFKK